MKVLFSMLLALFGFLTAVDAHAFPKPKSQYCYTEATKTGVKYVDELHRVQCSFEMLAERMIFWGDNLIVAHHFTSSSAALFLHNRYQELGYVTLDESRLASYLRTLQNEDMTVAIITDAIHSGIRGNKSLFNIDWN